MKETISKTEKPQVHLIEKEDKLQQERKMETTENYDNYNKLYKKYVTVINKYNRDEEAYLREQKECKKSAAELCFCRMQVDDPIKGIEHIAFHFAEESYDDIYYNYLINGIPETLLNKKPKEPLKPTLEIESILNSGVEMDAEEIVKQLKVAMHDYYADMEKSKREEEVHRREVEEYKKSAADADLILIRMQIDDYIENVCDLSFYMSRKGYKKFQNFCYKRAVEVNLPTRPKKPLSPMGYISQ